MLRNLKFPFQTVSTVTVLISLPSFQSHISECAVILLYLIYTHIGLLYLMIVIYLCMYVACLILWCFTGSNDKDIHNAKHMVLLWDTHMLDI